MEAVHIAVVVGGGLIGKRHLEEIDRSADARIHSIVEPGPDGEVLAARYGVRLYPTLDELLAGEKPDGIILATPNRLHAEGGLACVAAGVPVIVEKPIADTVENATRLVEASEAAGVPVLTGHHRNYGPVMAKARAIVQSGRLGPLVAVVGTAMFYKPDDYFDVGDGWRRNLGGGPILLNLIHEVNNLLSLVGDIVRVQAVTSNATRGFPVETPRRWSSPSPTVRWAPSCSRTPRRPLARGNRRRRRTSATHPSTTRTATTSPAPMDRCRCRPCG